MIQGPSRQASGRESPSPHAVKGVVDVKQRDLTNAQSSRQNLVYLRVETAWRIHGSRHGSTTRQEDAEQ
jgi:hypothetical protein